MIFRGQRSISWIPFQPVPISETGQTPRLRVGRPGIRSFLRGLFRPVNLLDQSVTIFKQRLTGRKTSVDFYPATNIIAMFGANYPADTTGFWFVKSADRAGTVTITVNAKGELLNVSVGSVTKSTGLVNSYKQYSFEFQVIKGYHQNHQICRLLKCINLNRKGRGKQWTEQAGK
jgi:hypothetical protein